jgi:hypothetical protein
MGMLMVRCPKTGLAISTGRHIESRLFSSTLLSTLPGKA